MEALRDGGNSPEKNADSRRNSAYNKLTNDSLTNEAEDEIKNFYENHRPSISGRESLLGGGGSVTPFHINRSMSRDRFTSRARDALKIPTNVRAELDEKKIFELQEAFLLFDLDGDGCINHNDLRGTLLSLGERVDEQAVDNMLAEAPNPLDFDGFVNLLGYRTLELDSEDMLVAALSRWDKDNSGFISEQQIRHDLMTWGDRFTEKEADYALDEAPTEQKGGSIMIDYVKFCSLLSGLRKAKKGHLQS